MSYRTWTTYGFGFCVDDIYKDSLSVDKILKLAAMDPDVLEDVNAYINQFCLENEITKSEFSVDDFDELEGDFCERGIAYILYHIIEKKLPVIFADDFDCVPYILYCPSYPWRLKEDEKNLTEDDVVNIFNKYIGILTDVTVNIDYQAVENGG
jgi:hypothetical protein